MGHRISDCPSRKKGLKAKQRPDGTYFQLRDKFNGGENGHISPAPQSFQAFSFNIEAKSKTAEWLVDSGCNKHLTPFKDDLADLRESNMECTFGNNEVLKAEGTGHVKVEGYSDVGDKVKLILHDVLYVPGLPQRLLSTGQLRRVGGEFIESDIRSSVLVMPDQHTALPLRKKRDYLWLMAKLVDENNHTSSATVYAPGGRDTASLSLIDWHKTLGHSNPASIMFLEQRGLIEITGIKTLDDFNCRICKESKSTVPHYQRGTRSIKRPGEVVHVDLVGPFIPDMYKITHLMVFVDEASRHKCIFGLRTKDEAYRQLQPYQEGMQLKGVKVKCIRGDGAGQLGRSTKFRKELASLALKWESSPPLYPPATRTS